MSVEPTLLELEDPRWAAFVSNGAGGTPFHHPAWAQLLAETYGYRGFALAVCDEGGRPTAGVPLLEVRTLSRRRRWISLPFTDECAPLAPDAAARHDLAAALARAQERLRAPAIEVRGALEEIGWRTGADAVVHVLDLGEDLEATRKRFSRSRVVRNISRAEREGVVVRRAAGAADLEAFYALHARTRRRQGVPVQPRRFFELIWSRLVERDLAFILLADAGPRRAVAGALFLAWNGTTIYKFGASDPESLPHRPNHLIFWTAIQEACARGDRRFDFGRTDLGNDGLRSFKSGWGAAERPLAYSTLERGAADGAEGFAARAMGVAIRRGPAWVCRGVGETLYRYAASR
jgi:CelD/BcsL family acetyltransferase involved in cellulose biosynthesis